MSECPSCGAEVYSRMKFCGECGAPLTQGYATVSYSPSFSEYEDVSPSIPEAGGEALLIELDQVEGTAGRRMHDIGGSRVTVGRSPKSDIFLDDVTVSRQHAEIRRNDHGFTIKDVGSLNGTYVNRVRVDEVDLRNGDEIQVGKYRFRFVSA